jgi:hypothetical protein
MGQCATDQSRFLKGSAAACSCRIHHSFQPDSKRFKTTAFVSEDRFDSKPGAIMEGINPFWFHVILVATIAGPAFLVFTIVAGIVWLFLRSKTSRTIFVALLACTVIAGLSWLVGLTMSMFGARWP